MSVDEASSDRLQDLLGDGEDLFVAPDELATRHGVSQQSNVTFGQSATNTNGPAAFSGRLDESLIV